MILYFSGTGNSLMVAQKLGTLLDDQLYNMECGAAAMPQLSEDESLGIVFPVYAWGLPRIVNDFLLKLNPGNRYVWTVMTCGDDMGYADKVLEKVLHRSINASFSVQMPNTYVCLPGFDVDSPELTASKLEQTSRLLPIIAESIKATEKRCELTRGAAAWLKTYVLRPLFNRFLVTDRYFKTTDECSSCGMCAKQCPVGDIVMQSKRPTWKHQHCTGCLRCYHSCPKRAIEWGTFTMGKGQKFAAKL